MKFEGEGNEPAQTSNYKPKNLKSDHERAVFIDNVPNEATREDMEELFKEYGDIISTRLLNRRPELPGKCFLEFSDKEMAQNAIKGS